MSASFDTVVIGGGLVGLATAYQALKRSPSRKICVLEKEKSLAQHQSSRNSGVLHSGVYYKPGSLKAHNCIKGKTLLEQFCEEHGVLFSRCGKLIVAKAEQEIPALLAIHERAIGNEVACEIIDPSRMREIEPHVAGVKALYVKAAGVVDFPGVAKALKGEIEKNGGTVLCDSKVTAISERSDECVIETTSGAVRTQKYVNCGGLYSDRLARLSGLTPSCRIVPFRGEYYVLRSEVRDLCRALIYPVPNPAFPFLGVHLTRSVEGIVDCGPNAVWAFSREGYSWKAFNFKDFFEALRFRGFQRLSGTYWREGFEEILRSLSKKRFVQAVKELVPEVQEADLIPAPAGVRAQAVTYEGRLVDDFLIEYHGRGVHVLNAPSPAATSCLSIGLSIVEKSGI